MVPILIVDDDEVARFTLAATLGPLGHPLLHAEDGEAAWDLLSAGARPAVCCCDVMMPRLDGVGLLQRAAVHPVLKHVPFVLVSSAADADTVRRAAAAGVRGYVLKPFLGLQTRATVGAVRAEELASRAEHFLATRRRLDLDLPALQELHLHLLEALDARLADAPGPPRDRTASAWEHQAAQAEALGLWRCRALLLEGAAASAAHAVAIAGEVRRLVAERLDQLVRLAPAVPSGFGPATEIPGSA